LKLTRKDLISTQTTKLITDNETDESEDFARYLIANLDPCPFC
jgi:hypothetical protein